MKIALLTNGVYPFVIGGIQKHSYFLAKYFAKVKIMVTIYHPGKTNEDGFNIENYFDSEELQFINFIVVPFPKVAKFPGHYVYASYLYSKELYRRISKVNEPYFLYAQGFTSWCFLNKQSFQHNLISNLHGLEMFQRTINLKNGLEQLLLRVPAKYIVKHSNKQVSLGGKLTAILYKNGAKPNSVIEIPNGIDTNWIQDIQKLNIRIHPKKKMKFVFVGRYERRKGIEEFQEVIKNTIDTLNYEVDFIGPIPKEKQLKHANVNYLGTIMESDKIKALLVAADVLVCPSYSEGMPTVILEAMACGCAIIATDVGATNTMVSAKNGWLIKGDIVSGLTKGIQIAVKASNEEIKLKKQHSLEKVKINFKWEKVLDKTIKALTI